MLARPVQIQRVGYMMRHRSRLVVEYLLGEAGMRSVRPPVLCRMLLLSRSYAGLYPYEHGVRFLEPSS